MSFYEEPKAFPVNTEWDYGGEQGYKTAGMNLRDYFASKAMQSLIVTEEGSFNLKALANESYNMADAMMEARK
jgi:hypothetical protein